MQGLEAQGDEGHEGQEGEAARHEGGEVAYVGVAKSAVKVPVQAIAICL